ncbi:MAG: hypothetical protein M0Z30_07610 [Actinomycetota bacterium]|nr:hypothetical protein [Actinomycetota bacterium]
MEPGDRHSGAVADVMEPRRRHQSGRPRPAEQAARPAGLIGNPAGVIQTGPDTLEELNRQACSLPRLLVT